MIDKELHGRIERAAEIAIFAPVGIAMMLKDVAPTFIQMMVLRGHSEVGKKQTDAEERLTTAKSTGEVAIAFGLPIVKQAATAALQRLFGSDNDATESRPSNTSDAAVSDLAAKRMAATTRIEGFTAAEPSSGTSAAEKRRRSSAADRLAIKGYDELAASHVVERLPGLSQVDLLAVHAYETAHRGRRTILAKIDQLTTP